MNWLKSEILPIFFLLIFSFSVRAEVINVPGDQLTIQEGLNTALYGDTVLVAPGTYYENIRWPNVDGICLIGSDTSNTIICDSIGEQVIYFIFSDEITDRTKIKNLTIRNSGMYISSCSPRLESLLIENSTSFPGISFHGSHSQMINCCVRNNGNSTSYGGGGIKAIFSCLILENVEVCHNVYNARRFSDREEGGGGIRFRSDRGSFLSNVNVHDNQLISGNESSGGGGIYTSSSGLTIYNSYICNNICDLNSVTLGGGGGIYQAGGNLFLYNSVIENNSCYGCRNRSGGGGLFLAGDSAVLDDVDVIANHINGEGNFVDCGGGGLYILLPIVLRNVRICENTASGNISGGGVLLGSESVNFSNVLISSNNGFARMGNAIYKLSDHFGTYVFNNITIEKNHSNYNTYSIYIFQSDCSEEIEISNSNFNSSEGNAIINNSVDNYFRADNCWWGDISGPYHNEQNPVGRGDSISGHVELNNWLNSPDTNAYPFAPGNLRITSSTGNSVLLEWDESSFNDIEGYKLFFDEDESGYPYNECVEVGSSTEYLFSDLQNSSVYYFAVSCYDSSGYESWLSDELVLDTSQMNIGEPDSRLPTKYEISSIYPNPFNPVTTVNISLPETSELVVMVYNVVGQRVATIAEGVYQGGNHSISFDGSGLASGVYLVHAVTPGKMNQVKKVVLMK